MASQSAEQPNEVPRPTTRKTWDLINDIVKSPLFFFLFGSSFVALYPAIKAFITPDSVLKAERQQAEARAEAALVGPFIQNLSTAEPGKFEAARAALKALEKTAVSDSERPVFIAVNAAIDAVALQLYPPSNKSYIPKEEQKKAELDATVATPVTDSLASLYSRLQNVLVYLQADRSNDAAQAIARTIRDNLREHSVLVPAIEPIDSDKTPSKTQVRYFNEMDRDEAEDLAAVIERTSKFKVYLVKLSLKAKPGALEVWIGKDQG